MKNKNKASAAVPEPIKKERGGLRDYSEAQAKTVQRVSEQICWTEIVAVFKTSVVSKSDGF